MDRRCNLKYKNKKISNSKLQSQAENRLEKQVSLFCLVVSVHENISTCESTLEIVEGLVS